MSKVLVAAAWGLSLSVVGCTFVTSCPTPGDNPGPGPGPGAAGSGGAQGTGGSGTGGINIAGSGQQPDGVWENVTSNLVDIDIVANECGSAGLVYAVPGQDRLIVGVSLNGLWSSDDGGSTWAAMSPDSGIINRAAAIIQDPADPERFWEVGNYSGPGVFETRDGGANFETLGEVSHLDFLDIDFSDPDRKLMLAGGHELAKSLYRSEDGGATWAPAGQNLPEEPWCTAPIIIDPSTYVVGCMLSSIAGELYRTTDAGESWERVSELGSNRAPLRASDQSIYWPGLDGGLLRSTDQGETWTSIAGAGTFVPVPLVELPDASVAAMSREGIAITKDAGETWTLVTKKLAFDPWTFTYSAPQSAFFASHGECGFVAEDAVVKFSFEPAE